MNQFHLNCVCLTKIHQYEKVIVSKQTVSSLHTGKWHIWGFDLYDLTVPEYLIANWLMTILNGHSYVLFCLHLKKTFPWCCSCLNDRIETLEWISAGNLWIRRSAWMISIVSYIILPWIAKRGVWFNGKKMLYWMNNNEKTKWELRFNFGFVFIWSFVVVVVLH